MKPETCALNIMSSPIETVRLKDPVQEVIRLFSDRNISAAAVLDENDKPIGVITKTDLMRFEGATHGLKTMGKAELAASFKNGEPRRSGYHVIDDEEIVQSWMTPVIFSVKGETSIKEIARRMVRYGIHHIFVQGKKGKPIIGIVSSFDILRKVSTGDAK